jgi:hypothetical protein
VSLSHKWQKDVGRSIFIYDLCNKASNITKGHQKAQSNIHCFPTLFLLMFFVFCLFM